MSTKAISMEHAARKEEEAIQILCIEPDSQAYDRLAEALTGWFQEFVELTREESLSEGIRRINSGKYDLIITEVEFPGHPIDPVDVAAEIMEQGGAADTPVILLTSIRDSGLPIVAFQHGVTEVFSKEDIGAPIMEYRFRNLLQREYRNKIFHKQFVQSLDRFQRAHGLSQDEIQDLNSVVEEMKRKIEEEYKEKMRIETDKNRIQSLFGMYVDPVVLKGIMNNEISTDQRGQLEEISVLFSDIRGYTAMSETLSPGQVVSFLNEYFTSLTEVIMGNNGMVDKYIGDAIMCLFGTPVKVPNHCEDAVQTAVEMQDVFELWVTNWQKNYGITPAMGIGVATGQAVVGNIGSFQKLSFTAVGDSVNVAARLQGLAGPGEIVISASVYNNLSQEFIKRYDFEALEPVPIKGKTGLHQVYWVTHHKKS
ncbi:MAG: adenylate/guanylate cyclase domain-containing response regulator [Spirochaetia bacterium]|nr:adenylate/guanylate cyclase domain-containing response regulator [Spirochaetia bacterium]